MLHLYLQIVNRLSQLRREEGQTLTEYALILVLVAIAAIVAVTALGSQVSTVFDSISTALGIQ